MEWATLGWRDGILLLVAGAALYLVLMLLKLVQISRRHSEYEQIQSIADEKVDLVSPLRRRFEDEAEPVISPIASAAAVSAYADEAVADQDMHNAYGESFATPPAPTFEWDDVKELFGDDPAQTAPKAATPAVQRSAGFGEQLADHLARTDVETEMQRMRDEMERMRKEMEDLRAARRVSPQYAEAVELAQRGMSPQDVADQLGISLAEAELVQALSRGRQNFDEGEDHGAEGYATYTGHAGDSGQGRKAG